jgi:hypothetical protein
MLGAMRFFALAVIVLFIALGAYGYKRNPAACQHLLTDLHAIYVDPIEAPAPDVATNAGPDTTARTRRPR